MADYTTTYGISNVSATSVLCHIGSAVRITVQENYNSVVPPTCDLLMQGAGAGSSQINVSKGTPAVFTSTDGGFIVGQVVGYIQTYTGSCTVMQLESVRL